MSKHAQLPATSSGLLLRDDGTWVTPPLSTRATATYTTAVLAAGGNEQGAVVLAKSYRLLRVSTSVAARVRLYSTTAARAADVARAVGVDPGAGAGVVLDLVTTAALLAIPLSPQVNGSSLEAVPTTSIPLTVTATGAGAVTVTLTWIPTEG